MISCCLSLLFLCFSWLNKNIVGTSSTVRIIFNGKPNHSHKKQKDSLEGSLNQVLLVDELELLNSTLVISVYIKACVHYFLSNYYFFLKMIAF